MKRYLAKMYSVIKTDGFVPGLRKIIKGLWSVVAYAMPADILFISSGAVGDSWRFRVQNVAEELRLHGFSVSITIQENVWLESYASKFKVFIFHKTSANPSTNPKMKKIVEDIKLQGKEMIFETDDLIFDLDHLKEQEFYKHLGDAEKIFYENLSNNEIFNDSYVKTGTVTTTYLADRMREYGKQVFVVPNKLSLWDLKTANKVLDNAKHEIRDAVRIGYFSGSMSHDRDFATIHDVLVRVMEKYPNVELYLAGPMSGIHFGDELNKFRERVKKLPHVPREKHLENISRMDINIAPLESNPFCEAKSELKYFEAGIVRIPTVATSNQTYREAIIDGEDGFVADGNEEWFEKLEKLIVSRELRESMGDKARGKAIKVYSTENSSNKEYYAYLKSKIK